MKTVFIAGYDHNVKEMFEREGWIYTRNIADASLVVFTGGEDVSPRLYHHVKHISTGENRQRDDLEVHYYHDAKRRGIPMAGICRGGQLLNVLSGGTMYQDVSNHASSGHLAKIDGDILFVSSTHHQMMKPGPLGTVVGVGVDRQATKLEWDVDLAQFITRPADESDDIEVVLYENILCFQPHPEYSLYRDSLKGCKDMFFKLIDKILVKA